MNVQSITTTNVVEHIKTPFFPVLQHPAFIRFKKYFIFVSNNNLTTNKYKPKKTKTQKAIMRPENRNPLLQVIYKTIRIKQLIQNKTGRF
jgi:hypothetical protein